MLPDLCVGNMIFAYLLVSHHFHLVLVCFHFSLWIPFSSVSHTFILPSGILQHKFS